MLDEAFKNVMKVKEITDETYCLIAKTLSSVDGEENTGNDLNLKFQEYCVKVGSIIADIANNTKKQASSYYEKVKNELVDTLINYPENIYELNNCLNKAVPKTLEIIESTDKANEVVEDWKLLLQLSSKALDDYKNLVDSHRELMKLFKQQV